MIHYSPFERMVSVGSFGPLAAAVVGAGPIAYGVFLVLRGKYERL